MKPFLCVPKLGADLGAELRAALLSGLILSAACALAGCASPHTQSSAVATSAAPTTVALTNPPADIAPTPTAMGKAGSKTSTPTAAGEVRTRNAVFKLSSFDELPGWQQDDLRPSWSAFRNSCEVLQKRADWREICTAAQAVPPNPRAMRSFFESRFTLLRILNTDASREGDVTGYFEPLLEGQPQRDAEFNVPVLGVPRDLYTLDWTRIPKPQREGIVRVRPQGNLLVLAQPGEAGSYAMDLKRFDLDDRDRRLRVRLSGDGANARAEPYFTRAQMEARGLPQGIDAPVVIWVNDPLALYAMQVQGSGRVRLPDGAILRLQYAEQNGHPFKPLRVVSKASTNVVTRGAGGQAETVDEFQIEGEIDSNALESAAAGDEPLVTRGGKPLPTAPSRSTGGSAADPLVDELMKGARKPSTAPARPAASSKAPAKAISSAANRQNIIDRLDGDPSYVFFKTAGSRPASEGPQGALGVPLTPGRSVAVDPRVTPLGYPVFLSAPAPVGSSISMQRLVFAQDTGGAIRGAVRADYFWGFGSEAGQMARSTRHRGQMWVLLPTAEASRLAASRIVTRGAAVPGAADDAGRCLVDDGDFCSNLD